MTGILGIDPGLDGGLALVSEDGRAMVWGRPMPTVRNAKGRRELDLQTLAEWIRAGAPALAAVERQQAFPKQGVVSCFQVGLGYGALLGLLAGLSVRHSVIHPKAWQSVVLGAPAGQEQGKARSLAAAKRLWPDFDWRATSRCRVAHDGITDAACIAEYGRRAIAMQEARNPRPSQGIEEDLLFT